MSTFQARAWITCAILLSVMGADIANANAYREKGKITKVANSSMTVIPPRDWNRLEVRPGKHAEVWTLDGEQLNDVTFYGGIEPGTPLLKERDKKRQPLPKLTESTLIIEIPELLEGTYRAYKQIGDFTVTGSNPTQFLGQEGVSFTYEYIDQDDLPRKGEARAALVNRKLFMVTFDAPRLHYFERTVGDFRALAASAELRD